RASIRVAASSGEWEGCNAAQTPFFWVARPISSRVGLSACAAQQEKGQQPSGGRHRIQTLAQECNRKELLQIARQTSASRRHVGQRWRSSVIGYQYFKR